MRTSNYTFSYPKNNLYSNTVKGLQGFRVCYRFSFNGQEKDDEVSGVGNTMTAEFWEYDSRLGRRWNVDPVIKPWYSPFAAFSNNPLIYIDPQGNTDFYWKGKYIGTDGNKENGLIAIVQTKTIKREIKAATKAGLNTKDYSLCNGDANINFNVLHIDILKESVAVLENALSTPNDVTEYSAVMDENSRGGFDKTFNGASGTIVTDSKGNTRVSGGSVPGGDIRIHSHPLDTDFDDANLATKSYAADEPTACDPNPAIGGDLCDDLNYKLNIIVGYNGYAPEGEIIQGKAVQIQDNRNLSINVFDSNNRSKPKFTILAADALTIIKDQKIRTSVKK